MSLTSFAATYTTTTTGNTSSTFLYVLLILVLVVAIVALIGVGKMYAKAGKPGWGVLIPFYNVYLMAQIAGKPGWWGIVAALVTVVPFIGWLVSVVMTIVTALGVGRNFGKSDVWSVILLWLLPIGSLILGYGKAQYVGDGQTYGGFNLPPAGGQPASAMPSQPTPQADPQPPVISTPPAATPDPTQPPQQPASQQPPQPDSGPQGPIVG